ncbi:MAG: hypothetical protein WBD74_03540 [Candidatus Aquilonibacter sp.]
MGSAGRVRAGSGLVTLGVVFMAFGAGGFLGFVVGRSPVFAATPQDSPLLKLTERHANEAEYLAQRAILGISRLRKRR